MLESKQQVIERLTGYYIAAHGYSATPQALDLMITAYKAGYQEALVSFAYWDNGTQMVGSCGTKLSRAVDEFDKEWE